jgi:hypothetical protein
LARRIASATDSGVAVVISSSTPTWCWKRVATKAASSVTDTELSPKDLMGSRGPTRSCPDRAVILLATSWTMFSTVTPAPPTAVKPASLANQWPMRM